ncbi:uncharacterized protein LOC143301009 [Babylonia areolata]|uniref:uncharacterized protein LOC143301009 n=1 Tax=Babylonia areolata TaxID=304850 RepID=UPI003FD29396
MALDAGGGCEVCGILILSGHVCTTEWRELCRTCLNAGTGTQTPCGACYCKLCGILIDPFVQQQSMYPGYCSACTVQVEDINNASGSCRCDFCSNHYNMSPPPARRSVKPSIQTTSAKQASAREGGSSFTQKLGPETGCDSLRENLVEEELRKKWEREQLALKKKLVTRDSSRVKKILQAVKSGNFPETFYIGGVDISFIKDNNVDACAALIIISFPHLEVVYQRLEMIQLTAPYIPGFLAFREVDSLLRLYKTMLKNAPQYKPDVIFVDGNGRLHPRAFGLACHLGVLLDLPCVGVAKTLIHVDGIEDNADHKAKKQGLKSDGDTFPLTTSSGDTLGMALRATRSAPNPIYVSLGHKISLQSAVALVHRCCKYRIPEPTRFADLYSRQYLADKKRDPVEVIVSDWGTCHEVNDKGADPSASDWGVDQDAHPSASDWGVDQDALPSPSDWGVDQDAHPSASDWGVDQDALPSPSDWGVDQDAHPSPSDWGVDQDAHPSASDWGVDQDALPSPSDWGVGWEMNALPDGWD